MGCFIGPNGVDRHFAFFDLRLAKARTIVKNDSRCQENIQMTTRKLSFRITSRNTHAKSKAIVRTGAIPCVIVEVCPDSKVLI